CLAGAFTAAVTRFVAVAAATVVLPAPAGASSEFWLETTGDLSQRACARAGPVPMTEPACRGARFVGLQAVCWSAQDRVQYVRSSLAHIVLRPGGQATRHACGCRP